MTAYLDTDIAKLDQNDPLAEARKLFYLPDGLIYLDGNSLGAAPLAAFAEIDRTARKEWACDLIGSWNKAGWFDLPSTLGAIVADIVGATADEVVVCDTTSINIYKALHAALSLRPGRNTIVAEAGSFPTDLYMIEGVASTRKKLSVLLEGIDSDSIESLIDEQTAVILVNHVDYRSGRVRDIAALTQLAHDKGALVVLDLCHSAGIMPIELNRLGIDLAIGCTYKYLNGGPGSPAFLYCAQRHIENAKQPLTGWWGHGAPFAFDREFRADPGIRKFLCGTQPILSFQAMKPGLEIIRQYEMIDIRNKSKGLTSLFMQTVETFATKHNVNLVSPRNASERGSQISLTHENGYEIIQAMIARGVVGDFRMPNIMRFGFAPLYISYQETYDAAMVLKNVLESGQWREPQFANKAAVT